MNKDYDYSRMGLLKYNMEQAEINLGYLDCDDYLKYDDYGSSDCLTPYEEGVKELEWATKKYYHAKYLEYLKSEKMKREKNWERYRYLETVTGITAKQWEVIELIEHWCCIKFKGETKNEARLFISKYMKQSKINSKHYAYCRGVSSERIKEEMREKYGDDYENNWKIT